MQKAWAWRARGWFRIGLKALWAKAGRRRRKRARSLGTFHLRELAEKVAKQEEFLGGKAGQMPAVGSQPSLLQALLHGLSLGGEAEEDPAAVLGVGLAPQEASFLHGGQEVGNLGGKDLEVFRQAGGKLDPLLHQAEYLRLEEGEAFLGKGFLGPGEEKAHQGIP
jgi:hypothetical protein